MKSLSDDCNRRDSGVGVVFRSLSPGSVICSACMGREVIFRGLALE